jgi:hypothetical protein
MEARAIKGYELARMIGKQTSFVSRLVNDEIKETLPVSDMAALERALGIPQVAMLRALGYDIPASEGPVVADFRLQELISTWPRMPEGLQRSFFEMFSALVATPGLLDNEEPRVAALAR